MTDLIKRLRDTASKGVSVWGDLQMEAAAEIERLREDAARWNRWYPWIRGVNKKPFDLHKECDAIDAAMKENKHD